MTSLWRSRYSHDSVLWLTEDKARESALRKLGPGRDAIHLATHGFFLAEGCYEMEERVNPLLRSGLVLAGANVRSDDSVETDDGILTALELSALNFSGVGWAVLSGCDTGIGPLHDAEGVLGLRRALQVAGARTVIMSLWSVPDEATRHWMEYLYEARLKRKQTTIAAVRHANLQALAMRRKENVSDHPFYWAGFVASGDWR